MRAAVFRKLGSLDDIEIADVPAPVPAKNQVLVSVRAAGISFSDVLIAERRYHMTPDLPFTPGSEVAGIVKAVGADVRENVRGVQVGDRVMARPGRDACREEVVTTADRVWKIPAELDFTVAAGFGANYLTSYLGAHRLGKLQAGETLLVLGASGGVGLAAVDIGRMLGARVIACASSASKLEVCRAAGASDLINYESDNLREHIKELTGGRGIDVCYDAVGGRHAEPCVRSMAWNGRYLVVGFAGGDIPKIPLNLPLLKGCSILGVQAGFHAVHEPSASRSMVEELIGHIAAGRLKPLISAT